MNMSCAPDAHPQSDRQINPAHTYRDHPREDEGEQDWFNANQIKHRIFSVLRQLLFGPYCPDNVEDVPQHEVHSSPDLVICPRPHLGLCQYGPDPAVQDQRIHAEKLHTFGVFIKQISCSRTISHLSMTRKTVSEGES